MNLLTTSITALAFPIMAVSIIPCKGHKKINTESVTIVAPPVDSNLLIYHFNDASTPPRFHRSYTIQVAPGQVNFMIDVYGSIILKDSFLLIRAAYDSFATALDGLHLKNKKEVISPGCTGGTSEMFTLYPGGSKSLEGHIDYCGGRKNGNLEGDLVSASGLFRAMVPDLYKRIDATKKDD